MASPKPTTATVTVTTVDDVKELLYGKGKKRKGSPQTPKIRAAAERNWRLRQIKGIDATLNSLLSQFRMTDTEFNRDCLSLIDRLHAMNEAEWAKQKEKIKEDEL